MIATVIIVVGAVLVGLAALAPSLEGVAGGGAISELIAPITLAVTQSFTLLGYITPVLVAVVPLYVLWRYRKKGESMTPVLFWGLVYGVCIYGMAVYSGLDDLLVQEMRGSMYVNSVLGTAIVYSGTAAQWILNIIAGFALWGAGLIVTVIGGALDVLVGVGKAAEKAKKPVKNAQKSILERLLGRGS